MNLKTKRIMCLLVAIISILTIVGTVSYAYFTAVGETQPINATLSTATVSVTFSDNDEGISGELSFGESITKRFTIENTGTADASVKIYWDNLVNTYLSGSLTYSLSYSQELNGQNIELISNREIARTPIPITLTKELSDVITVPVGKTYYYTLEITLNNLPDVDQTGDLDAKFYSNFKVEDSTFKNEPNFDKAATTDEGVFEMEDDYGTSYYYRGAVENNYVKFGGFYWRIIRINGDGSVRMIYDGTQAWGNGNGSSSFTESGTDRFIATGQKWNANYNDAKYAGWMFGGSDGSASTSKSQAQTNTTNADIKDIVDAWYKTNIYDKNLDKYVGDEIFCNDRTTPGSSTTGWTSDTGLGYGTNATAYGATARTAVWNGTTAPTFTCPTKNDAFTVSDKTKGNGSLTYKVGLITADEVVAAGSGKFGTTNRNYYLYKTSNYWYWSLSPRNMNANGSPDVFIVNTGGALGSFGVYYSSSGAVAPVINLSAEYAESMVGTGTMTNPYRAE